MTTALLPDASPSAGAVLAEVHRSIGALQDALRPGARLDDPDTTLVELDRAVRRLESVRLQVVAAADASGTAAQTGLADTTSWVSRRTRTTPARAASDVRLATALASDAGRPCADALATGAVSPDHARVIVQTTEQLPAGLTPPQVARVEQDLVDRAADLTPEQLRRAARRALASVEADQQVVDRHEDALLRTEEQAALARTRLTWHDNEDGTTSGHFTVPTIAAAILARVIQSMTAPRRAALGASASQAGDPIQRRDWAHASGLAFVELLEHLPTDRLHGKVAATVVVTIDHTRLEQAVGAARIDTDDRLSAGELRRIACGSGILPAVLDGHSLPLDLGRSSRLFSESQRVALATRHTSCAADGCERPYAWCELHHRDPWSHGGRTDLADAVPLCGFHHRRIHDPAYRHRHGPGGVTFHRRT